MTYGEIIYFVLDSLKTVSDDSFITEDHILFIVSKLRAMILKLRYSDMKSLIPHSNYQTICLDLEEVPAATCNDSTYLRSKEKVPQLATIGNTSLSVPNDYFNTAGNITLVSPERMKMVGHNKWLQNIIYASIGSDSYLYLKSGNPLFTYLEGISLSGIFEDAEKASELQCESDESSCDIMDKEYPLEDGLVSTVLELAVKYLSGIVYRPKDEQNDAKDILSDIQSFIRRNMKNSFMKLQEDE